MLADIVITPLFKGDLFNDTNSEVDNCSFSPSNFLKSSQPYGTLIDSENE